METEARSEEALLTPEELADYLRCSRTYAYQILARGEIPSLKLGKLRRIRREDAELYVDDMRRDSEESAWQSDPMRFYTRGGAA